ncbi:hypothetical protein E4K66_30695 [Bradyrhizobium frederickii]|uniref:Uncharacterized protein n=1 Tax=Bradyrhizobium frederickii TaxID=2560054 RepID=A0A4Y9KT27_9BRAD|nr:hypothetical protein [Bradyrhizobium frederickii]TFV34538.1 hypothetical protein E4K66_30695 [Bradyrhizobium frederickii]
MAEQEKTASEKLVSNVALTLWARGAMIVATSLILPIALMIGSRAVSNIDKLGEKLDAMKEQAMEQSGELKSLRQLANTQQQLLADHETRVRALERGTIAPLVRQ